MREEADGHSVDPEDGLCRFSDLPPSQCHGHWAAGDGRWLANRTWAD